MPEIRPGDHLSHYRIVEKLGEGGMGVVWKALDTRLDRHVALKLLPQELTSDPERRRRFLREARAAAAVTHPNIVTVHEVDEAEGTTFLCMELVDGRTLGTVLGNRSLPIGDALRIAAEIVEGLVPAHRAGIVHRDLKPENVILGADGHPKILDFGLAKLVESRREALLSGRSGEATVTLELTGAGAVLGTTGYMSPEQARGEPVDARSDIFSFGVMLYEMVAGRRPFHGTSRIETLAAILHEPAVPASRFNAEVPARLEEILGKCLEKDAGSRYQTTEDLAVDLRRLRRDLEYEVAPTRAELGTAQKPGRSRCLVAVLPFGNLSAEPSQAYFAGGLHDELLTQLSKVAALKVISRTSVMGYAGTTKPLKAIAGELGVGSIVEGSVQVVGERLRVNVQLIDAATDQHLWAESYDRKLDDAFAIQSEVAQRIVAAVGGSLTDTEQARLEAAPTANPEAYQLYLQGREYWLRPGFERRNKEIAGRFYERALELDPDFALAHAALAQVHGLMFWYRWDPSETRVAQMREEARAALRLAPDLPEAHIAMAFVHDRADQDFPRALAEFELALRDRPNDAELWSQMGFTHRRLGNWEKVLEIFEKAAQLNPRSADVFGDLGSWTYMALHRHADAVREMDRALSLAPDVSNLQVQQGWEYVRWQGQLDSLRVALSRVSTVDWIDRAELHLMERSVERLLHMPEVVNDEVYEDLLHFKPGALYAAWAHELGGDRVAARAAFAAALARLDLALPKQPEDWRIHAARGLALVGLGRRDEALQEAQWLERSKSYRGNAVLGIGLAQDRAMILARAGDADAALAEIERLLVEPSMLSAHLLRLDPRWDPIREHPRFKEILAKQHLPLES